MPTEVFSFFSGLGLLDLGFENAGFNIVFVNEFNDRFLNAYKYARRNNNIKPRYGYSQEDIRVFLSDEKWEKSFPNYNLRHNTIIGFIGGPPCPDFSVAGNNVGEHGKHGQLTLIYVKLIEKRSPDFFVLENVKGLYQTKKHRMFYQRMKRRLYRAGYTLFDSIENALEYGVPQFRDRLFLIGFKRSFFGKNIQYEFGNHRVYNKQEIENIKWPSTNKFVLDGILDKPTDIIEELTVEYWFEHNNVLLHPNNKDYFNVKKSDRFNTVLEGDTSRKSFKRLHRWRFSPTAAYGNNEVHLHPYKQRRISVAEALAIQSLPADFSIPNELPLSTKFKMIGNGVPYLLAYGIAMDISEWLENHGYRIGVYDA